jgi:hypothetical protein
LSWYEKVPEDVLGRVSETIQPWISFKVLSRVGGQVGHHVADIHRVVQMPRLAFLWMTIAVMYSADVVPSSSV